ncbi:PE-PGRS family protein [Mycolicibacterium vaccae ATCC 25954]|uniref:PE-PGRS family protein n=2 Tax=Mycolicibacterium vaccae TaxID=1810 RepID=K0UVE5_MYCVA|nr:PE-PGRS family protein [Mycolicibacterium vaccae 95051]EJZ11157.1 PE-PGRS family protein [Mycolicibacterium vaccae ATCC 25954]
MLCAATAQAAPDDTSSSTTSTVSAGPTSERDDAASADSSTRQGSETDGNDADEAEADDSDADAADDADADAEDADADEADDVDEADDADDPDTGAEVGPSEATGDRSAPNQVPTSVRYSIADTAESLPDQDVDETPVVLPTAADDDATETVDLAQEQITQARDDLRDATWGSGNLLAGLAAMLPQMWMYNADASLERWQMNHARLQEQFAATAGNPFAHWIAAQRIEASIMRTIRVQDQLEAAEKWLPVVGWFGPRDSMAAIGELIAQAAENGLVYQIVELDMESVYGVRRVNPIMMLSINGGAPVRVLLDTGSYGLVIDPQAIGLKDIGAPIDYGSGCYASCLVEYDYEVYNIPIAVDDDVVSARTPVLVVTLDTWAAVAETNSDYVGILGIGPKAGPGDSNPLTALPGLLGRGMLIEERRNRAILGPNPYAARVTLDGAPSSDLMVKVGDNAPQVIETWIDSGGVFGNIPASLVNGADNVAPGTLISVYTEDGATLLFSYRTTKNNTPFVVEDSDRVLMGFPPFAAGPIYVDFRGEGKTIFNYA